MYSLNWKQYFISQKQNFDYKRHLPDIEVIKSINTNYLDFSTNDYLGINHIPEIKQDIQEYIAKNIKHWDFGATGSRLLSGNTESHIKLEKLIAVTKGSEDALIFSSGYQTNSSVLFSLLKNVPKDQKQNIKLFCDKANHESLHEAYNLLYIKQIRYEHNNLEHLETRLEQNVKNNDFICIATESVFSMDGDITNIDKLVNLAKKYNALLYIDEAHATGIMGKN